MPSCRTGFYRVFFFCFFFWPTELMAGFGVALRAGPAVADWLRESRRRLAALFDDEKKKNGRIQNVSYRVSFVVSAIGWHLFFL